MDFGERLKSLRTKMQKSQAQVAREISEWYGDGIAMSQAKISLLEQRDSAPDENDLRVLSDYFGVSMSYFYDPDPRTEAERRQAIDYLETLRSSDAATIEHIALQDRVKSSTIRRMLHDEEANEAEFLEW